MRTKEITDAVIRCGEAEGWYVSTDSQQRRGITIFEFSKFTPAGQDFSFSATMKGKSLDTLVADMETYYENFDVDEETYLWLGNDGHGKNGAPYRMKDVLTDMEAAEQMIDSLIEAVKKIS